MSRPGRKPPEHKFTFALWEPDLPETRGGAIPVPHTLSVRATSRETAVKLAAPQVPEGWTFYIVGHVRSQYIPAHPGIP